MPQSVNLTCSRGNDQLAIPLARWRPTISHSKKTRLCDRLTEYSSNAGGEIVSQGMVGRMRAAQVSTSGVNGPLREPIIPAPLMTRTKIHTISAKGKDPTGFDESVNDYLRAGWRLHGDPYVGSYAQNVMRHGHQEIQVEHVLVQVMMMEYDEDDDDSGE